MIKEIILAAIIPFFTLGQNSVLGQDEVEAQEVSMYYGMDAAFSSQYMWRGISYNHGLVAQPDVYIGWGDWCLTFWSNITLWDIDDVTSNELDFTLSYGHSFRNIDAEASLNYYNYFGATEYNTGEAMLNLSLPLGNFTLFNNVALDFLEYSGALYNETGVAFSCDLSDKFSLTATALGALASGKFNQGYLDVDKGAFNFVGFGAMLTRSMNHDFYLDLHVQWNQYIDEQIRETLGNQNSYIELIIRKEF